MPFTARDQFLDKVRNSLQEESFVKLTLSQRLSGDPDLRNVYARRVELRDGPHLSFLYRYTRRDVTKNFPILAAVGQLERMLGTEWERAHLFTTGGDWQLRCDANGTGKLKAQRPVFTSAPQPTHDRTKKPALSGDSGAWLRALGVTDAAGEARPGMADKLRQIQRFVELLGHLFDGSMLVGRQQLRLADMGAGKGYLTFAAADFLRQRGIDAEVVGVELREDLVALTNRVAQETGFPKLRFVQGRIGDTVLDGPADILIALHACDTATDDALHTGIAGESSLIVTAPCCHKEVRGQMHPPEVLQEVLRHGILLEREAETITDAIRALLLEIRGYKATVFEFISSEHTGKNVMIAARRRETPQDPEPLRKQLRELLRFYGIRQQHLAALLSELPEASAPGAASRQESPATTAVS